MSRFTREHEAVDKVLGHVRFLLEQGKNISDAIDHTSQRYGIERFKVERIVNDSATGRIGNSGTTTVACLSTPSIGSPSASA